jgi:hypothetical protein
LLGVESLCECLEEDLEARKQHKIDIFMNVFLTVRERHLNRCPTGRKSIISIFPARSTVAENVSPSSATSSLANSIRSISRSDAAA